MYSEGSIMDVLQNISGWEGLSADQKQVVLYVCDPGSGVVLISPEIVDAIRRAFRVARKPVPDQFLANMTMFNRFETFSA